MGGGLLTAGLRFVAGPFVSVVDRSRRAVYATPLLESSSEVSKIRSSISRLMISSSTHSVSGGILESSVSKTSTVKNY